MSDEIKIPDRVAIDAEAIAEGESDYAAWQFIAHWAFEEAAKTAEKIDHYMARLVAQEIRQLGRKER